MEKIYFKSLKSYWTSTPCQTLGLMLMYENEQGLLLSRQETKPTTPCMGGSVAYLAWWTRRKREVTDLCVCFSLCLEYSLIKDLFSQFLSKLHFSTQVSFLYTVLISPSAMCLSFTALKVAVILQSFVRLFRLFSKYFS